MPGVARKDDVGSGICYGHPPYPIPMTGKLQASATSLCNNRKVGVVGDTMLANCGHTGKMISGSPTVLADGKPVVRLGDPFTGTFVGTLRTASTDTTAD